MCIYKSTGQKEFIHVNIIMSIVFTFHPGVSLSRQEVNVRRPEAEVHLSQSRPGSPVLDLRAEKQKKTNEQHLNTKCREFSNV